MGVIRYGFCTFASFSLFMLADLSIVDLNPTPCYGRSIYPPALIPEQIQTDYYDVTCTKRNLDVDGRDI